MQVQLKARNYELSPEMRAFAESKLARLEKQLSAQTLIEVELAAESKRSQFTAEGLVFAKGQTLRAVESTSDMRASIDALVANLERQVVTYREKRRLERRRRAGHHGA